MQLQTHIPLEPISNPIDYESKVLLLGSCFSQNIGDKLSYFKFQSVKNPFGVLFHPVAIENLITKAINEETYSQKDVFFLNERWHCFDAHSVLSDVSKEQLLTKLNNAVSETSKQLHRASHIIITLGTAWAYRHIETDRFVANCHKVPQKKFTKQLLTVEEVVASLERMTALIKSINAKINVLFTVSPVRHIKDGFIENQQSKAHLLAAVHEVIDRNVKWFPQRRRGNYFPAYEIMMDELRDYRFYAEDMVHPNQLGIDYIWEKFQQVWIASEAKETMKTVDAIQKGMQHRPFNPNSEQHQAFLQQLEEKKTRLKEKYSHIMF